MSIILNVNELEAKLKASNVAIIDVRTEEAYAQSHIPGAVFLDVKKELKGEASFFPHANELAEKLGNLGIRNEMAVIFYDGGNHRAASKAWVAMQYIGHEHISILDGGFEAWVEAKKEIAATVTTLQPATYEPQVNENFVVGITEVKDKLDDDQSVLIDSRSHERFTGEKEPKYKRAGHIPGAKNFHSKLIFDEAGNWKEKDDLATHFSTLENKDEVIVSCGSGNSACMNIVALKAAGFDDVKLYPGGFSEWIDKNNKIDTGDK